MRAGSRTATTLQACRLDELAADWAAAEAEFEQVQQMGVSISEIALPYAHALMLFGNSEKLLERIKADGLPLRLRAEVLAMRATAQADRGDMRAAVAEVKLAREADPRALSPLLAEIDLALRSRDSGRAQHILSEGLLMAPAYAVPRMLARAGLKLQDFDYYEIHEAFASQVLSTLKAWEDEKFCKERLGLDAPLGSIDRSKLNVKGSSLAAGHPFAATGGRIIATAAKILNQKGSGRILVSICAAGGQGVTAIIEK